MPVSFFFIPVVYAALNFGLPGAVATGLWATVITIPNWVFWHHGIERWGVIFQMVIVDVVGVFVGQRVEMESRSRRRAEAMGTALRASEARYRGLFETAGEAVLVVQANGLIKEANEAASEIFGIPSRLLSGRKLSSLVMEKRPALISENLQGLSSESDLVLRRSDGRLVHLQPVGTTFVDQDGDELTQLILHNVTEQRWKEEGLRNYAAQILQAQEEERKRIAQELHDETIQSLVQVCRELDTVERLSQNSTCDNREHLTEQLVDLREEVMEIAAALRHITHGLRPPILDDLGLVPTVRRLVDDFDDRTSIPALFDVAGEPRRLHPAVELGLFRIAQEALRNVERHAGAHTVHVRIRFHPNAVHLCVQDDGLGFRLPAPGEANLTNIGCLGLVGMQERARLLGGVLEIHTLPGAGTTVTVTVAAGEPSASTG